MATKKFFAISNGSNNTIKGIISFAQFTSLNIKLSDGNVYVFEQGLIMPGGDIALCIHKGDRISYTTIAQTGKDGQDDSQEMIDFLNESGF